MHLTEQMILARSRERDLASIQKLNIWDCDLTDVSILERLPNLEMVILTQNHIQSLKQFQHCYRLQELYLHWNNIQDIEELIYLKNLPLKRLGLANNPCSRSLGDNYRLNVIKMLPFLEYLDNQAVTEDELNLAMNLRVLERNLENQNVSQQQTVVSPLPTDRSTQASIPEFPDFGEQTELSLFDNMATLQHSRPNPILNNFPRQFAEDDIMLPPAQPQKSRCNRSTNFNSHHSHMNLAEWEKRNQTQENYLRLGAGISANSRPGFLTERTANHSRDELPTDYGCVFLRPSSCPVTNAARLGPALQADAVSVQSRNSSIVSSNHGRMTYPRSRRVNLLCASLRFILELDALALVDLLGTIRSRIEDLRSNCS